MKIQYQKSAFSPFSWVSACKRMLCFLGTLPLFQERWGMTILPIHMINCNCGEIIYWNINVYIFFCSYSSLSFLSRWQIGTFGILAWEEWERLTGLRDHAHGGKKIDRNRKAMVRLPVTRNEQRSSNSVSKEIKCQVQGPGKEACFMKCKKVFAWDTQKQNHSFVLIIKAQSLRQGRYLWQCNFKQGYR